VTIVVIHKPNFVSCLLAAGITLITTTPIQAFERTEEREPCANYQSNRQALFGDLHVHTSYSFDSYISSQRNDPWAAYRYATGEAIALADEDRLYYVRAPENPSCRWNTLQCQAAGVNPFAEDCVAQATAATEAAGGIGDIYGRCCLDAEAEAFYSPVIQERAWTSPIWYRAGTL